MSAEYSTAELLKFLDYLSQKGLMNKGTVVARKAASNNMLSILDQSESSDLRKIDINDLATRFGHLKGSKYTPKSLQVYKSRLGKALDDFFRYKENPANFTVGTKPNQRSNSGNAKAETPKRSDIQNIAPEQRRMEPIQSDNLNIPIAIRVDCVIQLNGIPRDLTAKEAQKVANVITAMAAIE